MLPAPRTVNSGRRSLGSDDGQVDSGPGLQRASRGKCVHRPDLTMPAAIRLARGPGREPATRPTVKAGRPRSHDSAPVASRTAVVTVGRAMIARGTRMRARGNDRPPNNPLTTANAEEYEAEGAVSGRTDPVGGAAGSRRASRPSAFKPTHYWSSARRRVLTATSPAAPSAPAPAR